MAALLLSAGRSALGQAVFEKTDSQSEINFGRAAYDDILRHNWISNNEAYRNRVRRVFANLMSALPEKLYPYQVVVIGSNEVNAGCLPGGYICINDGLIAKTQTDDEIAITLAHEIGHAAHRHWAKMMRRAQQETVGNIIVQIFGGTAVENGLGWLAFDRGQETDADRFGVDLYLRAGYAPNRVSDTMRMLDRVDEERGGSHPEYLSTHPSSKRRVADMEALCAKIIAERGLSTAPGVPSMAAEIYGRLPEVIAKPNPYLPMDQGDVWQYQTSTGDSLTRYKVEVLGGSVSLVGKVWRLRTTLPTGRSDYQVLSTATNLWRRKREAWKVECAITTCDLEDGKKAVLGPEELVEVPFGKLSAIKVSTVDSGGKLESTAWFAKDIGLVKRVSSNGTIEVLISFSRQG